MSLIGSQKMCSLAYLCVTLRHVLAEQTGSNVSTSVGSRCCRIERMEGGGKLVSECLCITFILSWVYRERAD